MNPPTLSSPFQYPLAHPPGVVRWGAVAVGVFSTLAVATMLGLLGAAIGFSALNAHNPGSLLGFGAGAWGIGTVAVSFFLGGWMSGRTTGVTDTFSRVLHGAMVWIVTVPLLVYALAGGVSAVAGLIGELAATAPAAGAGADSLWQGITPPPVEEVAAAAARTTWRLFSTLLLGFAAAGFGGYIGNREEAEYESGLEHRQEPPVPYHH